MIQSLVIALVGLYGLAGIQLSDVAHVAMVACGLHGVAVAVLVRLVDRRRRR